MMIETFNALAVALVLSGGVALAVHASNQHDAEKAAKRHKAPTHIDQPVTPKPITKPVNKSKKPTTSPETIEAMHKQADAERAIAEALEHKAQYITDPVKRARIEKQAALSWTQFNKILDRIDRLTDTD